jgi:hypothetical protein
MSEMPPLPGDPNTNWDALAEFVQHYHLRQDHQLPAVFEAEVSFRSDRNVDERIYIDFRASAVSPVRFAEKGELNPVFVHTEFRPTHTAMKFEDRELHIIGKSPKVGRFMVRITPLAM